MFIARVQIFDQRRSEGVCSSSYKHATPNGVKPVNETHLRGAEYAEEAQSLFSGR